MLNKSAREYAAWLDRLSAEARECLNMQIKLKKAEAAYNREYGERHDN
jgi:hypothetical protein